MCGCSAANISKQLERLRPAIVEVDGKEKIDSEKADEILKMNRDTARYRGPGDSNSGDATPSPGSMDDIRRQQALAKLAEQQLDLAQRKGETLPRAATMATVAAAATSIREHLQARNRRLAEQAATMTDAREIKAMLDKDDRAMLEMISHDFMQRISPGSEGDHEYTVN